MTAYRTIFKRCIPATWHPTARRVYALARPWIRRILPESDYEARKRRELEFFTKPERVDELPLIAHYWSTRYLVPLLQPFGFTNALECFRSYLLKQCRTYSSTTCAFLSIGAGSSDAEINMAQWLIESGVTNFRFDCADINDTAVQQAKTTAAANGVQDYFTFAVFDINKWKPNTKYHAIIALQSLHHFVELELLFDSISRALLEDGYFLADDMIGRNGHQRWPEALSIVQELWKELPSRYKYNQQLRRFEERYENWDCSQNSFEGIRAQHVLPLLIQKFYFEVFVGFGNVIDIFIDRSFGHNFDPNSEWDRSFIDRVHAIDVRSLEAGTIKPTHMLAVMKKTPTAAPSIHKHFTPEFCVRTP